LMNNLIDKDFVIESEFKIDEKGDNQKTDIIEYKLLYNLIFRNKKEDDDEIILTTENNNDEDLIKPPEKVFNEDITFSRIEYLKQEKFKIEPEDYIKDQKALMKITQKIYTIIPLKSKDFGMVLEDKKKKKYDGQSQKNINISSLSRRDMKSVYTLPFSTNTYRINLSRTSITTRDAAELYIRKEKNKQRILNEFINDEEKFTYQKINPVFLNYEKFLKTTFNDYLISLEKTYKKGGSIRNKEIQKKKKEKKKEKKEISEVIDIRTESRKILNFDLETDTKMFNEWSGFNVIEELCDDSYANKNNEVMDKMTDLEVILWKSG